jgi:hypothetical protein
MISVKALVIVTMVLGGVGSVWAQAYTPDLLRRAELGNASAQYELGVVYAQGRGVARDYGRAAAWYRKARQSRAIPVHKPISVGCTEMVKV